MNVDAVAFTIKRVIALLEDHDLVPAKPSFCPSRKIWHDLGATEWTSEREKIRLALESSFREFGETHRDGLITCEGTGDLAVKLNGTAALNKRCPVRRSWPSVLCSCSSQLILVKITSTMRMRMGHRQSHGVAPVLAGLWISVPKRRGRGFAEVIRIRESDTTGPPHWSSSIEPLRGIGH